jgi:DNA-binding beta-propeller fold protein YncE
MGLHSIGFIQLPEHMGQGGFDHAAYDVNSGSIYVAHTINDALDVIDCQTDRYTHSIPGLGGVAGALVSPEKRLVFTSNRAENTVGIFGAQNEQDLVKIAVGLHPNGLSFDSTRGHLLAANVGDLSIPGSFTLSFVDIETGAMIASIPVDGRTRWTVYHHQTDAFYVNIADPAQIVVVAGNQFDRIARTIPIPAMGPHGLDLDDRTGRLFCACDGKELVTLDVGSERVQSMESLSGSPDVIFFNSVFNHLYVASGDPGVIDVFDTNGMSLIQTISTERGAHTIGFDSERQKIYAFLPQTHRAMVFQDTER